jgi:hypothetical protein
MPAEVVAVRSDGGAKVEVLAWAVLAAKAE